MTWYVRDDGSVCVMVCMCNGVWDVLLSVLMCKHVWWPQQGAFLYGVSHGQLCRKWVRQGPEREGGGVRGVRDLTPSFVPQPFPLRAQN